MKRTYYILSAMLMMTVGIGSAATDSDNRYIREDRVWEYYKEIPYWLTNMNGINESEDAYFKTNYHCLATYAFQGTEEINNRLYHRCVFEKAEVWSSTYDEELNKDVNSATQTVTVNQCVGLLREENGKVYMRPETTEILKFAYPYSELTDQTLQPQEDMLLYDFTVTANETVYPLLNSPDYGAMITETVVRGVSRAGEEYDRIVLDLIPSDTTGSENPLGIYVDCEYAAGIGNVGCGLMTKYGIRDFNYDHIDAPTRAESDENAPWVDVIIQGYRNMYCWFNNYYDKEENVLYTGLNMVAPNTTGIKRLEDSGATEKSNALFDLTGRPVSRPLPGSVYILNGMKIVFPSPR